ncbi:MAG TPA: protein translocase subunit SecD [Marmoricola sp.]|nr:protein translocase subunit SecD [Marmoricola sp.]
MMAKKASRHGRTLIVFLLAVLAMYGGLALNNDWTPKLGLDLQGGTRITLEASTETGEAITPEKLEEAAAIIDSRVNAYGVAESEISTQGERNIIIEIPGPSQKSIVDSVRQTAQLRFRLVAGQPAPGEAAPSQEPTPSDDASSSPGESGSPEATPGDQDGDQGGDQGGAEPSESATPAGRAVSEGLVRADETPAGEDAPATGQPEDGPAQPEQQAGQGGQPVAVPTDESSVEEMLAWARNPDQASLRRFQRFVCGEDDVRDVPSKPIVACDEDGNKYLLSPAIIEGTQLADAGFGIPQNDVQYVVNLDFNGEATDTFAEVTRAIVGTNEMFAIVLDGEVLSAPVVTSPITDGNAQISGNFTASSAESLANSLKYGALPLQFELLDITDEGPQLAADQLDAGIWAGIVGLALVVVYSMVYYRGLGIVVVGSLAAAAAILYAAILFLSQTAGFTLTLPGIAGLIVGVGITADSFIVLFERIRDEMRDGKSIRVAIETGWDRAKMTCVIADAVGLLAAVVLFIFAIGVVKGFAFALGITTVIDLVVFFFFTKPLVSWLAQFRFFSSGHKLSGLSAEQAGIDRIGATPSPAGGIAR